MIERELIGQAIMTILQRIKKKQGILLKKRGEQKKRGYWELMILKKHMFIDKALAKKILLVRNIHWVKGGLHQQQKGFEEYFRKGLQARTETLEPSHIEIPDLSESELKKVYREIIQRILSDVGLCSLDVLQAILLLPSTEIIRVLRSMGLEIMKNDVFRKFFVEWRDFDHERKERDAERDRIRSEETKKQVVVVKRSMFLHLILMDILEPRKRVEAFVISAGFLGGVFRKENSASLMVFWRKQGILLQEILDRVKKEEKGFSLHVEFDLAKKFKKELLRDGFIEDRNANGLVYHVKPQSTQRLPVVIKEVALGLFYYQHLLSNPLRSKEEVLKFISEIGWITSWEDISRRSIIQRIDLEDDLIIMHWQGREIITTEEWGKKLAFIARKRRGLKLREGHKEILRDGKEYHSQNKKSWHERWLNSQVAWKMQKKKKRAYSLFSEFKNREYETFVKELLVALVRQGLPFSVNVFPRIMGLSLNEIMRIITKIPEISRLRVHGASQQEIVTWQNFYLLKFEKELISKDYENVFPLLLPVTDILFFKHRIVLEEMARKWITDETLEIHVILGFNGIEGFFGYNAKTKGLQVFFVESDSERNVMKIKRLLERILDDGVLFRLERINNLLRHELLVEMNWILEFEEKNKFRKEEMSRKQ